MSINVRKVFPTFVATLTLKRASVEPGNFPLFPFFCIGFVRRRHIKL